MNPELFRKTLEFSKQLRNSSQTLSKPDYPQTTEELLKRTEPLIKALFKAETRTTISKILNTK